MPRILSALRIGRFDPQTFLKLLTFAAASSWNEGIGGKWKNEIKNDWRRLKIKITVALNKIATNGRGRIG